MAEGIRSSVTGGSDGSETIQPEQGSAAATAVLPDHEERLPAEFIPTEVNLATSGYYDADWLRRFPGRERRNKRGEVTSRVPTRKTVDFGHGRLVHFLGSAEYGWPNAGDRDYEVALSALIQEQLERVEETLPEGTRAIFYLVPQPFGFTTAELLRKCDRQDNARERRAVREWIKRNHATVIEGSFKVAGPSGVSSRILAGTEPFITRFFCRGDDMGEGTLADKNLLWFAPWLLDNFKYGYVKSLDLRLHQALRAPIAKLLYPLLDRGWFASNGHPYQKRYSQLAALLSLKCWRFLADIKDQIDPALQELQGQRFLEQWEYRKASDGADFVIRFFPGPKWHEDQAARARRGELAATIEQGSRALPVAAAPLTPELEYLVTLLEDAAGRKDADGHSRAFYEQCVRKLSRTAIFKARAQVMAEVREGRIQKSPAHLLAHLLSEALDALEKPSPPATPAGSPSAKQGAAVQPAATSAGVPRGDQPARQATPPDQSSRPLRPEASAVRVDTGPAPIADLLQDAFRQFADPSLSLQPVNRPGASGGGGNPVPPASPA